MIEVIEAAGPRIVVDAAESGQKQKRGAIVRRRVVNLFAALLGFDRHSFKPFRHAFAQIFLKKRDRKSTRLNSSHQIISYAVFCLKKKKKEKNKHKKLR